VTLPALWPHQEAGFRATLAHIAKGVRRVLLSSPTGGGKTRVVHDLVQHYLATGRRAVLYVNRKMMVEQASKVFTEKFPIPHGIRASGHEDQRQMPFQISSIQTEDARVLKREAFVAWPLHDANLVVIDEMHLQKGEVVQEIMRRHLEAGAVIVGVTATPLELGDYFDAMVQAGTNSELRKCGALVKAYHYAPDEPDLQGIKVPMGEDLSEKQNQKAIMRPGIFGRVIDSFKHLNPDRKPTILFAPGVKESLWFAEEFEKAGISAAHIDGDDVWIRGEMMKTNRSARMEVLNGSRDGDIKVICNRFVLREGIDAPWLAHAIFATVFGSLQSYLQSGGRVLRSYPDLPFVVIQDHGGNWWRHGSLNADRLWHLTDTNASLAARRDDRLRDYMGDPSEPVEREPTRCSACGMVLAGRICQCGQDMTKYKRSRIVVQHDGTLKEMLGDIYTPKKIAQGDAAIQKWIKVYWRASKSGMSFRHAAGLYASENGWRYPSPKFPLMPRNTVDWYRRISDVPRSELNPLPPKEKR
jgi:superfamily II DNA or RNA helicase